jgi:hypothetical protein
MQVPYHLVSLFSAAASVMELCFYERQFNLRHSWCVPGAEATPAVGPADASAAAVSVMRDCWHVPVAAARTFAWFL